MWRKNAVVSMQDLEQLSYWQEKRFKSGHWYNLYNPVLSVELTEFADRVVRNNDAVQEIQLDLTVHQHRVPENNENLLMSMSDGLLRAVQHWIRKRRLSMKTRCYLTLQKVEPIALPITMRGADKYSSLCLLSMDCVIITHYVSDARLAEL